MRMLRWLVRLPVRAGGWFIRYVDRLDEEDRQYHERHNA